MTDITELAQRVKRIISDVKLKHGGNDTYAPIMKWDEFLALVEALEKAQQRNAELENYAEAEATGADKSAEDSVYWMRRCKELESRTIAVKLPDFRTTYKGSFADEVEHQVRNALDAFSIAAGIKWEAE
ncbi:Uncharacterised protein [Klebsiella pneumoniae]|uniref:hypothetical protein n=1 Tax=Klebsiella pneumoniae TaxID=573 RepID=UPI000E2AA63C|nr:hypothetical protein [Klebsiella pneumoniae]SXZ66095.1 Uncharacterised protein [Klebsiella pneumoniae]